jgi:hypothetical protein
MDNLPPVPCSAGSRPLNGAKSLHKIEPPAGGEHALAWSGANPSMVDLGLILLSIHTVHLSNFSEVIPLV